MSERTPVDLCLRAYSALRWVIRQSRPLEDHELRWVLEAEPDLTAQKQMVSGLLGFDLISRDQAGMQVYLRPEMKDA